MAAAKRSTSKKPKPKAKQAAASPSPSLPRNNDNDDDNKWALRLIEHTPQWLIRNPFIWSGYRVGYTATMALRSLFKLHNETGNVWTHLLGLILIMFLAHHTFSNVVDNIVHHQALFAVFLVGNVCVFLFSTVYHLFGCVSKRWYAVTMWLDYSGISILLVASFLPPIWFALSCHTTERTVYLTMITLLGSLAIVMPAFKCWDTPQWAWRRVALYTLTGASGVVPALHTVWILPEHRETLVVHIGIALMFLLYATGIVFYMTKFPESRWPGRFDCSAFSSHAIWHNCVTAAAVVHFLTCIAIYQRFSTLANDATCVA